MDDAALRILSSFYEKILRPQMKLVDLCAGWNSHLPEKNHFESVIGVGIQEEEMKMNGRLSEHHVQDLNENPKLAFIEDNSVDVVLCTFSVELLIRVSMFKSFNFISEVQCRQHLF